MKYTILDNEKSIGKYLADELAILINNKPDSLICLAAGHSSLGMFNEMLLLQKQGKVDFKNAFYAGLDEWTGFAKEDDGSCAGFLHKNLFDPLGIDTSHIHLFNGNYTDVKLEAKSMYEFIDSKGGLDYILLGMGMNGHIGLNEPGTPFDRGIHEIKIDSVTKSVGQKYFKSQTFLDRGITLGIKDILSIPRIVLTVQTERKRDILKKFSESGPDPSIPATALKLSTNFEIVVDKAASGELN